MRALSNGQIWTHILKEGVLVVDTCAYFDFGSSGSVRINASKKSIYVTIFVTILAGTMDISLISFAPSTNNWNLLKNEDTVLFERER